MKVNKVRAAKILKAADSARYKIALRRERAFLMPFIKRGEPWAELAAEHAAKFALTVDSLLKRYRRQCVSVIRSTELFGTVPVKKYRTNEYLDERYNRVVVPDVRDVLTEMSDTLEADLKREYQKQIASGFVPEAAELIYGSTGMDFNFNKFDEQTRDYLRDKTINWSKQVAQETERAVKRELVNGFEKGLDVDEITRNIEKSTGFSYERSELIARTEVMSAEAYAEYQERLANPNVIGTKWVSAHDEKTRPTHRAADGQERKLGEPFDIGGYKMLHPRDSSLGAPAKEIIRCRCSTITILRDTPIESNTVYDEPDAGTDEWLKRQPEEFREEYIGGKVKARLWESELLNVKDRDEPLTKILPKIYPVKTTPAQLRQVSSLPDAVAKTVISKGNALWLYGKLQNREANYTINAETGARAFKNIVGEHGKITDESEDVRRWLKYLDRAKPRSVVTLHNHNNATSFSLEDLKLFLSKESVKTMIVVDDVGNMFLLEKKPGVVYNANEIVNGLMEELRKRYINMQGLPFWKSLGNESRDEMKSNLYKIAINDSLRKAGMKIEKT